MRQRFSMMCLALWMAACSSGGNARSNGHVAGPWDDIDYSRLHRYESQQNDASYSLPTVVGCVDDDLYNCNP